jgi:glycerophosphoryl diester phosphodiesterase
LAHTPQIIAHRGASRAAPENTVEAYRLAAALGADAVELDVRRAADGRLVISHDPLPPAASPGALDLATALDACNGMWVNVEIKNDPSEPDFDPSESIAADTVAALLDRHHNDRWLISSFRMETIDRCRALAPEIPTAYLTVDVPEGILATLASKGHQALHPWYGAATASVIDAAHQRGLQVNVWTCDDPEAMHRLTACGVDGICTNVPDVAIDTLRLRPS